MSAEQKKGKEVSGHFVICDTQEKYSENLLKVLSERLTGDYQAHLFHDIGNLKAFAEKSGPIVLIIGEEYTEEERKGIFAHRKYLLTGRRGSPLSEGERELFRYQSADYIIRTITEDFPEAGYCGEPEGAGKKKKKNREKDMTGTSVRGLIGIYSPIHRIGKTRFALRLGKQMAERFPVLYLNLEGYSGGYGLSDERGQDLGDLLYFTRQENANPGIRISTMAAQDGGMDYIMPMKHEHDLRQVKGNEWLQLFETILSKCIYEAVILDLGDCVDGLYDILKQCSRVYTLYIDDSVSAAKMEQYERDLRDLGYGEVLNRTVKRRVRRVRHLPERGEETS